MPYFETILGRAERYKARFGFYPKVIVADRIYRDRKNSNECGAAKLAEDIIARARIAAASLPGKIAETRRLYLEADKRVMDIVRAVENGLCRPEMKEAMEKWGERKDALKEELIRLEATSEEIGLAALDKIIAYLIHFAPLLVKMGNEAQKIFNLFIERITVHETTVEVRYKVFPAPVIMNGRGEPRPRNVQCRGEFFCGSDADRGAVLVRTYAIWGNAGSQSQFLLRKFGSFPCFD